MVDENPTEAHRVSLQDESDLIVARRHVRELGQRHGLAAVAIEALATAVTEIARNVVVHAGVGELTAHGEPPRSGRPAAVVVVVRDSGPGIANTDAAMADGFSTGGGGLGLGLSGACRLVDVFELSSTVGRGTTVRLEKWAPAPGDHL